MKRTDLIWRVESARGKRGNLLVSRALNPYTLPWLDPDGSDYTDMRQQASKRGGDYGRAIYSLCRDRAATSARFDAETGAKMFHVKHGAQPNGWRLWSDAHSPLMLFTCSDFIFSDI